MTQSDYNLLSFNGKASILTRYGKLVEGHAASQGERIFTYSLFTFFVEVSYRFDKRVQYVRVTERIGQQTQRLDYTHLIHLN